MYKSGIAALIAVAGLSAGAMAGGEAFLEFVLSDTGDGDGIITATESAVLTVQVRMDWDDTGFPLVAFGGTIIDVLGGDGTGDSSWTILNDLDSIVGDTTVDEGENLRNMGFLQLDFTGYVTDNPIALARIVWDPQGDYSARSVSFRTDLAPSLGLVGVLVRNDKGKIVSENWAGTDASITFDVIPAPASLALLGLGGLAASRRRR